MKISELPPGLKELAEQRRIENTNDWFDIDCDDLADAFSWSETPEEEDFWNEIDTGNFTPFYNCKVVNFKLKEK